MNDTKYVIVISDLVITKRSLKLCYSKTCFVGPWLADPYLVKELEKIIKRSSNCLAQSLWWGKLGRQGAICWLKKELSMVHGTLNFFRSKTFLFVKIDIWNFQHLFDFSWNLTKFQLIRTTFIPHRKNVLWMLSAWPEIM